MLFITPPSGNPCFGSWSRKKALIVVQSKLNDGIEERAMLKALILQEFSVISQRVAKLNKWLGLKCKLSADVESSLCWFNTVLFISSPPPNRNSPDSAITGNSRGIFTNFRINEVTSMRSRDMHDIISTQVTYNRKDWQISALLQSISTIILDSHLNPKVAIR